MQGVQTWQTHLRRETVVLWSSFVFLHTLHTLHTFYKKVLYVVYIEYIEYRVYEEESRCEALMAVPPARPAPHRFSAPVFGRCAGVQGVQSWHSCVGAPPDLGFRPVSPLGCWSAVRRGFQACFLKSCWQRGKL